MSVQNYNRLNSIINQFHQSSILCNNTNNKQDQPTQQYVHKPLLQHLDIPSLPLHEFVFKHWNTYGNNVAVTDAITGDTFTYNELRHAIISLSITLGKRGLKQGDVIAVYSNNHIFYPIVQLAVSMMGGM